MRSDQVLCQKQPQRQLVATARVMACMNSRRRQEPEGESLLGFAKSLSLASGLWLANGLCWGQMVAAVQLSGSRALLPACHALQRGQHSVST